MPWERFEKRWSEREKRFVAGHSLERVSCKICRSKFCCEFNGRVSSQLVIISHQRNRNHICFSPLEGIYSSFKAASLRGLGKTQKVWKLIGHCILNCEAQPQNLLDIRG
jgi:hypothetical protein